MAKKRYASSLRGVTAAGTFTPVYHTKTEKRHYRISRMWGGASQKDRCSYYDIDRSSYYVACRRKVYTKIPDIGNVCKRHLWQSYQLAQDQFNDIENQVNEYRKRISKNLGPQWNWYKKREEEIKKIKEEDHWWFKKELMRELRGNA